MSDYERGNRERQNRQRSDRERSNQDRDRSYNRGDDWAQQVPWERGHGPYRDYGWERGESALPEFRDPSVHVAPYERDEVERWREQQGGRGNREESGPYSGIGPKGYRRADERIFEDVCERLTQHGQIDARDIEVNVKNGEVILNGTVDSRQTKRMAERVAEQVRGVKDIQNLLRIQQPQENRDSGMPGGGKGRVDEVGRSGVYPASGPMPQGNAPVQGEASWGQGERGAAGYEDSGRSEPNITQERGKNEKS